MKHRSLILYLTLFVVAYSASMSYLYFRDARKSTAALQASAPPIVREVDSALPRPVSATPRAVASRQSEHVPAASVVQSRPLNRESVETAHPVHFDAVAGQDEASALISLMSDPDPEVARTARAIYETKSAER